MPVVSNKPEKPQTVSFRNTLGYPVYIRVYENEQQVHAVSVDNHETFSWEASAPGINVHIIDHLNNRYGWDPTQPVQMATKLLEQDKATIDDANTNPLYLPAQRTKNTPTIVDDNNLDLPELSSNASDQEKELLAQEEKLMAELASSPVPQTPNRGKV